MTAVEDAVEKRFQQLLDGLVRTATVTAAAAGGKVTVQFAGSPGTMTLPRAKNYTPIVVGESVLVLCAMPGAWIVICAPATS